MQPNEIWKDIQGYEGLYQVSTLGRVRSLDRLIKSRYGNFRKITGKIIKPNKIWSGYLRISLWKQQQVEYKSLHRLVAETFIPNPQNLPCVNHKDEVKSNNSVSNLEWCTWNAMLITEQETNGLAKENKSPEDVKSRCSVSRGWYVNKYI